MNLHEYQAKRLFREYGIDVPRGNIARTVDEACSVAHDLGAESWVVKAQIHAGARGKGGGVRKVTGMNELTSFANSLLGSNLVTPQTDEKGLPVNTLLVEEGLEIDRELYMGMLVDRDHEQVVLMASAAGGMNIEELAETDPEAILKVYIDPAVGIQPWQCRLTGFRLGLNKPQQRQLVQVMMGMYQLFMDKDLSLIEINPIVVTGDGRLLSLDAKINIDDNALGRQPSLAELRDLTQEDQTETRASQHGLNYITLDGNIACMVNGAGLAMATMDVIQLHGGRPANFLDVGGGTTAEKVAEAFKIILSSPNVDAVLVNIFGGIVRCDLIAKGIIAADKAVGINVPVVVRVEGTNVEKCRTLLNESGISLVMAENLTDAAQKVVAEVNKSGDKL